MLRLNLKFSEHLQYASYLPVIDIKSAKPTAVNRIPTWAKLPAIGLGDSSVMLARKWAFLHQKMLVYWAKWSRRCGWKPRPFLDNPSLQPQSLSPNSLLSMAKIYKMRSNIWVSPISNSFHSYLHDPFTPWVPPILGMAVVFVSTIPYPIYANNKNYFCQEHTY